jgi:hypothetical protein
MTQLQAEAPTTSKIAAPGFWSRQFRSPATRKQRVFDFCFGIVAPVLCVIFDPVVFTPGAMGLTGSLYGWRVFGYAEIVIGVILLAYYLLTQRSSSWLAGALLSGALFALVVGIVLLPLTLLGMFILIGFFGLTPFLTAFVFLRNGYRCWQESTARRPATRGVPVAVVAAVLVCGIPLALQVGLSAFADRAISGLQSESDQEFAQAVRSLKRIHLVLDEDKIVSLYRHADARHRERLSAAYREITGRSIEDRIVELND